MPNDFGSQLHHLVSVMAHESDQRLLEQLGIGLSQFKILRVTKASPLSRQRVIARELGQTEASVSRQVKLLQAKAMLMIRINPHNQREHLIALTEKGIRTIAAAEVIVDAYHQSLTANLNSRQVSHLDELLLAVHTAACAADNHQSNGLKAG